MKQLPLGVQLRDHASFATFVAGSNADAVAQVRALLSQSSTPVTWLWGAAGTGKTHLLQAACAASARGGERSGYVSLGDATLAPGVLDGWDALGLVCGDDVHRIVGDVAWERALFALFNGLSEHRGRLLVASEDSPATLRFALPDLESRLRSGPVFQLTALDDAGRLEALRAHAAARGIELPAATARYLLGHTRRDMHSLAAMLETLDRASLAAQRRLTVPFVRELLADVRRD
jgi:DnaA family protein